MGDSKAKASVESRNAFYAGYLYIKNKIAYSQNLKSLAIMQKKVMQNLKFVLSN